MGLPKHQPLYTVDDYLLLERISNERNEYLDGQIFAMASESGEHGIITVNLVMIVATQLKGSLCQARTKDTKVRSGPEPKPGCSSSGLYSYPDLLVVCGEPEYHDDHTDVLLNPAVIMEVLSPTTESFDRGEKFTRYQTWNSTLCDYLLISQHRPQIEHYTRLPDNSWSYRRASGLEAQVIIPSIDCTLRLLDVYDRLTFATEDL